MHVIEANKPEANGAEDSLPGGQLVIKTFVKTLVSGFLDIVAYFVN